MQILFINTAVPWNYWAGFLGVMLFAEMPACLKRLAGFTGQFHHWRLLPHHCGECGGMRVFPASSPGGRRLSVKRSGG
jgi:hypothetical protein